MHAVTDDLAITSSITVPASVMRFTFSRSGGPGGQHVNKTSTRATLTVQLDDLAASLPDHAMRRLPQVAGPHLAEGRLVIHSDETRSQHDNRRRCREKLAALIRKALHRPRRRHKTRPSRASVRKRLDRKTRRGQTKQLRRPPRRDG